MSTERAPATRGLLNSICRMVLKPIVGILLRGGMPYAAFAAVAKTVYVDVARREFGLRGRRTNRSRIAMLTGLSRTQVRQVLDGHDGDGDDPDGADKVRHVSRVLLGWHTDRLYLDDDGHPRPLPVSGDGASFDTLYKRYSGKVVPPSTMLKELITVGAVQETPDGLLEPLTRSYTPEQTDPVALKRVLTAVRDLAATGSYNLYRDANEPVRFERFATNQLISADSVEEFHRFLEEEGQNFLERIDNWLTEREKRDNADDLVRIGVGVYQISPPSHPDENK